MKVGLYLPFTNETSNISRNNYNQWLLKQIMCCQNKLLYNKDEITVAAMILKVASYDDKEKIQESCKLDNALSLTIFKINTSQ